MHFNSYHLNVIRGAIERDPVHATIYIVTHNGWPDRKRDVPHITHHFWGTRDELTTEEGILLKGNRICIPPELYERTLHDLHNNHQGIKKMTHLAWAHVYLPGIEADILNYIKHCTICIR